MVERMSRIRLLAAFGAGVAAWEAVVHGSLLLNRQTPRLFGIRLAPRLNLVQTIVPAIAGFALARVAIASGDRPPFFFRLAARRVLAGEVGVPIGRLLGGADEHYAALGPKMALAATAAGRMNLRMSAYLLALFRAMRDEGLAEDRAAELIANGLFRIMRRIWQVPDALVERLRPNDRLARTRLRQRVARRLYFRDPDWVMREVPVESGFGVDVTRCVMRDFLASEGAARLCEDVLCRQDLLMAEARGDVLTRTRTLAAGGDRCDFRFA